MELPYVFCRVKLMILLIFVHFCSIHCGKLIKYLHVQTGLPILIGVAMKGKKKGGWLAWTLCMPEIGRRNFHCSIYMDSTVGIIQMKHIKTS